MAAISVVKTDDVRCLAERENCLTQSFLDEIERLGGRTSSPQWVERDAADPSF